MPSAKSWRFGQSRRTCVELQQTSLRLLTFVYTLQEVKLIPYKSIPQKELDFLEQADRFLIECLNMYRVGPRIKSMIYRENFLENIGTLETVSDLARRLRLRLTLAFSHRRLNVFSTPHPIFWKRLTSRHCLRCVFCSALRPLAELHLAHSSSVNSATSSTDRVAEVTLAASRSRPSTNSSIPSRPLHKIGLCYTSSPRLSRKRRPRWRASLRS